MRYNFVGRRTNVDLNYPTCYNLKTNFIRYLDKTYPDKPSPFLPDGTLPIDIESTEYKAALESYAEFAKSQDFPLSVSGIPRLLLSLLLLLTDKLYTQSQPSALSEDTFLLYSHLSLFNNLIKKDLKMITIIGLQTPD